MLRCLLRVCVEALVLMRLYSGVYVVTSVVFVPSVRAEVVHQATPRC